MDNLDVTTLEQWLNSQREEHVSNYVTNQDLVRGIIVSYNYFLLEKLTKEKGE